MRRKLAKRVVYKLTPNALRKISTKERPAISVSASELRRGDKTVFYTPDCEKTITDEQKDFFNAVKDSDGDYRLGKRSGVQLPRLQDAMQHGNCRLDTGTPVHSVTV